MGLSAYLRIISKLHIKRSELLVHIPVSVLGSSACSKRRVQRLNSESEGLPRLDFYPLRNLGMDAYSGPHCSRFSKTSLTGKMMLITSGRLWSLTRLLQRSLPVSTV